MRASGRKRKPHLFGSTALRSAAKFRKFWVWACSRGPVPNLEHRAASNGPMLVGWRFNDPDWCRIRLVEAKIVLETPSLRGFCVRLPAAANHTTTTVRKRTMRSWPSKQNKVLAGAHRMASTRLGARQDRSSMLKKACACHATVTEPRRRRVPSVAADLVLCKFHGNVEIPKRPIYKPGAREGLPMLLDGT